MRTIASGRIVARQRGRRLRQTASTPILDTMRRAERSNVVSGPQKINKAAAPSTIHVMRNRQTFVALVAVAVAVACIGAQTSVCSALELNDTAAATTRPHDAVHSVTAVPAAAKHDRETDLTGANITLAKVRPSGNELWDGLVNECMAKPTFSCFQKNVYGYLDDTLRSGDVNVTSGFRFVRNQLDEASLRDGDTGNEVADDDEEDVDDADADEARSASPLEEVTDALSGKGVNFLMMHNVEMRMPDMLFDGATVKISPRSFEGNGALVHFEIVPAAKQIQQASRLLFKPFKKLKQKYILKPLKEIKKLFRNKLLLSFLAIVLIVKLIKVKLFWVLPFIVGVGTAKKLLLKVILFLFPALAHIFKLCSHYHKNYHDGTKYHQHNHQINHLHSQVVPPWFNEPHHEHEHEHSAGYPAHEPELIYTSPPKGHPSEYLHGGPPLFQQHPQDWELSGPGLGSEYISNRNTHVNAFKSKLDEPNGISPLGGVRGTTSRTHIVRPAVSPVSPATSPGYFDTRAKPPPPENRIITSTQYHRQVIAPKHAAPAVHQVPSPYATVTDEKMLREAQRLQAKQLEALRIQAEHKLVAQQQQILQKQPFAYSAEESPAVVDPVYSPILHKVDKIMLQLGFVEESCKERLICSMYKSPAKYSPHSNFVSAELSRDMSELQKPLASNAAVVRFYRYVQSARDGQEQRDCLQLYGQCTINTEQ